VTVLGEGKRERGKAGDNNWNWMQGCGRKAMVTARK